MKPRLLTILLLLLAGAVVNVGVAWDCAIWGPWPTEIWFDGECAVPGTRRCLPLCVPP